MHEWSVTSQLLLFGVLDILEPILTSSRAERIDSVQRNARLPRSVQAVYLRPLRRRAEYGLPVCDLQLRSYSVRNVEFFADFATRAAYYLKLPLSGPVPLPRIVERWTMPRGHFAHKKTQENFERVTLRRLLQIKDGNLQAVQTWLAFLRKHAFYGVGMKANVWEHESLGMISLISSRPVTAS
jgi:ribosomal protein S10